MISLMVVAGDSTDRLADFLAQRGTFSVDEAYNNLVDNITILQNKIVNVDKLLYLYSVDEITKESDINIKGDMQVLRNLLINEGFFKPSEIIFISGGGETAQQAVQYFMTVMNDCKFNAYSIKTIEDRMSFSSIYNAIMGVSATQDFKNTYRRLMRVERNSEAELEYEPQDDTDLIVEPFRYDNVEDYAIKQKTSVKIDSGIVHTDSAETHLETFSNPDFGNIQFENRIKDIRCIVVSGKSKSGKSMWAAQLALSAHSLGRTTCVLDFTDNADIDVLLKSASVPYKRLRMIELLRYVSAVQGTLNYCCINNSNEKDVSLEFLQNFFSGKTDSFNTVFIVVEEQALNSVLQILGQSVTDLIFTCTKQLADVALAQEKLIPYLDTCEVSIILNDNIKWFESMSCDSSDDIKKVSDERIRLIGDKTFKNMTGKAGLFKSLFSS